MKYAVLLLLLIAPCTLLALSKQDYPITIHITASYIGESCDVGTSCKPKQILDVVIAGKKYELQSLGCVIKRAIDRSMRVELRRGSFVWICRIG